MQASPVDMSDKFRTYPAKMHIRMIMHGNPARSIHPENHPCSFPLRSTTSPLSTDNPAGISAVTFTASLLEEHSSAALQPEHSSPLQLMLTKALRPSVLTIMPFFWRSVILIYVSIGEKALFSSVQN